MLNCPRCETPLTLFQVDQIDLDICQNGCGGIWFDRFELDKIDERSELDPALLPQINCHKPARPVTASDRIHCPKCKNIVMMRFFHSVKRRTEVDHCPGCGGHWLDPGELSTIQETFTTDEERTKASQKLFSDLFDKSPKEESESNKARYQSAQKFAKALRFVCPSYYLQKK